MLGNNKCPHSQDGTIQLEVKLTGEVSTTLASPEDGDNPRFGTLVSFARLRVHALHPHLDKVVNLPSQVSSSLTHKRASVYF